MFALVAHQAVRLNLLVSLATVSASVIARFGFATFPDLAALLPEIAAVTAGAVVAAWFGSPSRQDERAGGDRPPIVTDDGRRSDQRFAGEDQRPRLDKHWRDGGHHPRTVGVQHPSPTSLVCIVGDHRRDDGIAAVGISTISSISATDGNGVADHPKLLGLIADEIVGQRRPLNDPRWSSPRRDWRIGGDQFPIVTDDGRRSGSRFWKDGQRPSVRWKSTIMGAAIPATPAVQIPATLVRTLVTIV